MATTHQLSVIANSCVKPPINPDTGLSVTQDERNLMDMRNTWNGYPHDCERNADEWQEEGQHQQGGSCIFNKTDSLIQDLTADMGKLSDAEFYKRLVDLKNEHKKTLNMCENLYTQKVEGLLAENGVVNEVNDNEKWAGIRRPSNQLSESLNNSYNAMRRSTSSSVRDSVKDMSKPPSGRHRPQSAKATVMRSMDEDYGHVQAGYSDEEYWKPLSAVTTDVELSRDDGHDSSYCYHHQRDNYACDQNESKRSALSHLEDMWDNFSVEEYAPPKNRQRSSSLSRASNSSSRNSKKNEVSGSIDTQDWRHRITLPKPFNMSVRESTKFKEKSQTLIEYEQKKAMERRAEEEECQKKFKAKPVPAHVYMPLFDEKMEEMESKRKFNRENSKEVLRSIEKPFNFMKREEDRRKYRSPSKNDAAVAEIQQKPPTGFKARPFPAHIFDGTVMDKLQEEEEYRKIRVQMRAEELLKTSSLPPNMAAKGKDYTDGKSRQKLYAERAKKAGITAEHKFKPRINEDVPDFEEKHRKAQWELSQMKRTKEATVCKPFNLRTERVASKRHKEYEDIARDAAKLQSKSSYRSRSKLSTMRSLSSSVDSIPAKMTASAQLRSSANRTKLQQELDAQLAELERERQQRLKEKKIKKYISERVALNDNSKDLERSLKMKMKEYKQSERERKEEYLQMLNEIEERIEKRPLLFERALQANAKKTAERKYQDTLRRAGLDEDYITSKGKEATNDDMEAVSDDDAYVISRHSSARSQSHRSRTASLSDSQHYSDHFEEGNRTSEGSDIE